MSITGAILSVSGWGRVFGQQSADFPISQLIGCCGGRAAGRLELPLRWGGSLPLVAARWRLRAAWDRERGKRRWSWASRGGFCQFLVGASFWSTKCRLSNLAVEAAGLPAGWSYRSVGVVRCRWSLLGGGFGLRGIVNGGREGGVGHHGEDSVSFWLGRVFGQQSADFPISRLRRQGCRPVGATAPLGWFAPVGRCSVEASGCVGS